MSTSNVFSAEGVVVENLPNTMFRVKVGQADVPEVVEKTILCTLSGRMRMNWVRLLPGDKVRCEVPTLDYTKGRIIYKLK